MSTFLPEEHPKTDLTLSAAGEVSNQTTRSADDPHLACRNHPLPTDRRHGGDFWSKVLKTDCCWLWTRSRTGTLLYGAFWQDGRIVRAHRVAYELTCGPIPDGLDLLHTCDVPHCVRPDHLRSGTPQDNQRDMVAKGRNAPQGGELNHNAKLSWDQVHDLRRRRAQGEKRRHLAVAFGVTPQYVYMIVSGRVWPESICPVHTEQAEAVA